MRILYVPLDERPCNALFPAMAAESVGVELVSPPASMLSAKRTPADTRALRDFVLDRIDSCDAAVLSVDMMVYGGLIPSRLHHLDEETAAGRLGVFGELRRCAPDVRLYAAVSVMRAPSYDSDEEEPDYYARYGHALFRRAWLEDRRRRGGLDADGEHELGSLIIPSFRQLKS